MIDSTILAPSGHPGRAKRKRKRKQQRPTLNLRADGRWQKKVNGRLFYFTGTADEALTEWKRSEDYIRQHGRKPDDARQPQTDRRSVTSKGLVNEFLDFKKRRVESGELSPRTWNRYQATGQLLVDTFGCNRLVSDLEPADFEKLRNVLAKRYSPVVLGVEIQNVRSIMRYAYDPEGEQLVDRPVRMGKGFAKPSAKTIRLHRMELGERLYTAVEIWSLIEPARPNMKAMILLAINGGLGPGDLATLTIDQCDGVREWLDHPRPKTGIARRIPLWPETRDAIRKAIAARREPINPDHARLLFIGRRGESYYDDEASYRVSQEFDDVRKLTSVSDARTFYDFRRTFQTIGENSRDIIAVRSIMGHAPATNDMSAIYRQRIDDERLTAVVNVVRAWLVAGKPAKPKRIAQ